MADIERLATSTSAGMRRTLGRLAKLAAATLLVTAVIGLATFATGWWVFDGKLGWIIVGGMLCVTPLAIAVAAWWLVRLTLGSIGGLFGDVQRYLTSSPQTDGVLIDYDSGMPLGKQARSYGGLREELHARRFELPALYAGVRAITGVPALAAISVIGTLFVGGIGTILLIVGLIG